MIKIHNFFHEILGETQKPIELILTIVFAVFATSFSFVFYADFLSTLPHLTKVALLLITLDITGGVLANLTQGTDRFYSARKKARLIFIIIHVQPVLVFFLTNQPWWIGVLLWGYTLVSAIILERIKYHPSQKIAAGFVLFTALAILFGFQSDLTPFVVFLMVLYLFKVLFSFSVNHHVGVTHETKI